MNTEATIFSPLRNFKEQLSLNVSVINQKSFDYTSVIVCGMGGSALSASITKLLFPDISLTLHNTYGLPASYAKETTLIILNSYSGNTEEVLESYERARKDSAHTLCISKGGKLLDYAQRDETPYIMLPEIGVEPRFSLGHQILALLTALNEREKIVRLQHELDTLHPDILIEKAKETANLITGTYPILYASSNLAPIAYLIKAAINEGAKIPCFVNTLPEANHNELQSFTRDNTNESDHFSFIFFNSPYDHTRITKRCEIMQNLYKEQNFTVAEKSYNHTSLLHVFEAILEGYALATHLALLNNVDPYKTPFITTFKERMAQ